MAVIMQTTISAVAIEAVMPAFTSTIIAIPPVICPRSLRAITTSKPKTRCKTFGQYSAQLLLAATLSSRHVLSDAINSGALLCTAPLVTILQDNVWLPPNFIAHTLQVSLVALCTVLLTRPSECGQK